MAHSLIKPSLRLGCNNHTTYMHVSLYRPAETCSNRWTICLLNTNNYCSSAVSFKFVHHTLSYISIARNTTQCHPRKGTPPPSNRNTTCNYSWLDHLAQRVNKTTQRPFLFLRTCTVESIAFKSNHTCAVEAAVCISTVSIGMAWKCLKFTLVDICRSGSKQRMHAYLYNSTDAALRSNVLVQLTPSPL